MEDYIDHKQECLWICRNTHWIINSTEKAIMKFQSENTSFSIPGDTICLVKKDNKKDNSYFSFPPIY